MDIRKKNGNLILESIEKKKTVCSKYSFAKTNLRQSDSKHVAVPIARQTFVKICTQVSGHCTVSSKEDRNVKRQ